MCFPGWGKFGQHDVAPRAAFVSTQQRDFEIRLIIPVFSNLIDNRNLFASFLAAR